MHPLLLLPGLMNDARVWQPVVAEFQSERSCVAFPTDRQAGVETIAAAAIKAMPSGSFCIAGFSLGGYVALEVFRQATERIKGLALLSTGGRAESEGGKAYRQRMIEALQNGSSSFANSAQSFLPRLLHPTNAQDPAIISVLTDMARSVGSDGFVRQQLTAIHRPDSLNTLQGVNVPSLILCGAEDQICPSSLSEEIAKGIRGAELMILPECGHMVTLERPSETISAISRWLSRTA
jgi:pimeloyl-ACP methyl ester carboxylesterase